MNHSSQESPISSRTWVRWKRKSLRFCLKTESWTRLSRSRDLRSAQKRPGCRCTKCTPKVDRSTAIERSTSRRLKFTLITALTDCCSTWPWFFVSSILSISWAETMPLQSKFSRWRGKFWQAANFGQKSTAEKPGRTSTCCDTATTLTK